MAAEPSVTHWILGVKAGDPSAAQRLWEGYFQRLVVLARRHLGTHQHCGADGEDVAQSVFKSLCLGAERGKYPQVTDRNNLWSVLIAMTANKSRDLIRRERSLKRGGGRVLDEAGLANAPEIISTIEEVAGQEPTPEFAVQVAERCGQLMSRLTDVERRTAELKLQSFTNREIAEQMNCGQRTVERRLETVRRVWENHVPM